MSSHGYDGPSPQRSSKIPTWLVVVLSIVLLLGLCCIGLLALMFFGLRGAVQSNAENNTRNNLEQMRIAVDQYHTDYRLYPFSLEKAESVLKVGHMGLDPIDERDSNDAALVYLLPADNAQPGDILIHTSIKGPLPILAETIDGHLLEFKSIEAFKAALRPQEDRLPAPAPSAAPPPSQPAGPTVPTAPSRAAP